MYNNFFQGCLRVQGNVVGRRKIGEYDGWMRRKGSMMTERKYDDGKEV